MEFEEAQKEFSVRFYRWANEEARLEVEREFPLLRQMDNSSCRIHLRRMERLSTEDQQAFVALLVKRYHPQAIKLLGETPLSDKESDKIKKYVRSFAYESDPVEQEFIQRQLNGDPTTKLDKRRFVKIIKECLEPIFGKEDRGGGGGAWSYTTIIEGLTVRTWINTAGRNNLQYNHMIVFSGKQYLQRGVSVDYLLGLGATNYWYQIEDSKAEETAHLLAELCGHFMNAAPDLLKGLAPQDTIPEVYVEEASGSGESSIGLPKHNETSGVAGEATPLLRRLEEVIVDRNPRLAEWLNSGLPESRIRAALGKAKVSGNIEALVHLYSWRNGTAWDGEALMEETSLFPESIYQFMNLDEAIGEWVNNKEGIEKFRSAFKNEEVCSKMKAALRGLPQKMVEENEKKMRSILSGLIGCFFPVFTDQTNHVIAIDLTSSKRNQVVLLDYEAPGCNPVQAYSSFEEFIKDVIRANIEGNKLRCFHS